MSRGFPAHGGNLEWAAERYGIPPGDFIDFSSNLNPLGPPPRTLEAARAALQDAARYPQPGAEKLRAALALRLGLREELLILGNGSSELIHHLARQAGEGELAGEASKRGLGGGGGAQGRFRVTVVAPAFGEYERAAAIARAETAFHFLSPEDGFSLRVAELVEAASRSRLTFFCNPSSPTGRLYGKDELIPVLEACRASGGILAVDESFMPFCPVGEAAEASLLPHAGEEGLVVISTFTKAFALAGLRGPGWMAGPERLISLLEGAAVPWRVNVVAQAAALACLEEDAYMEETRVAVAAWRKELEEGLLDTGLFEVFPSRANFLLLRFLRRADEAGERVDALGRRGMLVRDCRDFRGLGRGFLRVAVRTPEDNSRLLAALEEVCGDMGR